MRAFRLLAAVAALTVTTAARAQSAGPIPDAALEWLGIPRGATMLGPTDRAPAPPRVAELAAVEPAPPAEAPVPTVVPIAAKASQEFVVRHVHTVAWTPPPASASPVTAAPQAAAVQVPSAQSPPSAPVILPQVFTTTVQALSTPRVLQPGPIRHAVGNFGRMLAHADDAIHLTFTPWVKPPAPTVTTASAVQTLTTTTHQTTFLPPPAVAAPAPVAAVQIPLPTPVAPTK